MARIWVFVVVAVFAATAVSSKQVHGVDSQTKWQRADRKWLFGSAPGSEFFAGNKRPEGLPRTAIDGKEILQTLAGKPPYYFVSLFDTVQNSAFYSAYTVTPAHAKDIEKVSRKKLKKDKPGSMDWRNPADVPGLNRVYTKAWNTEKLNRGHLNPCGINSFDGLFMTATFTLTNTVPQFREHNEGEWKKSETKIQNYAKHTCGTKGGTLYLLTGKSSFGLRKVSGQPEKDDSITLPIGTESFSENGVNVVTPRALWTAGCCVWKEPGKVFGRLWPAKRAESFAVMSNNQRDKALMHQMQMSVLVLEGLLKDPPSEPVNLFPGNENCRLAANNIVL